MLAAEGAATFLPACSIPGLVYRGERLAGLGDGRAGPLLLVCRIGIQGIIVGELVCESLQLSK